MSEEYKYLVHPINFLNKTGFEEQNGLYSTATDLYSRTGHILDEATTTLKSLLHHHHHHHDQKRGLGVLPVP